MNESPRTSAKHGSGQEEVAFGHTIGRVTPRRDDDSVCECRKRLWGACQELEEVDAACGGIDTTEAASRLTRHLCRKKRGH